MTIISDLLGGILAWFLADFGQLSLAVFLLTVVTKLILFPVSYWIHENTLKVVGIQGEMNRIQCRFFGDSQRIAEEQADLFQKAGYHPLLSVFPLFLQIGLLLSVVQVIYQPLTYLFHLESGEISALYAQVASQWQGDLASPMVQVEWLRFFQEQAPTLDIDPSLWKEMQQLPTDLGGFSLLESPQTRAGTALFLPFLAGLSSYFLCVVQNKKNVLQAQQSKTGQVMTMLLSVSLSLYLAYFVPGAVGFYWICSNLLSIAQVYLLHHWRNPETLVDLADLAESQEALSQLKSQVEKSHFWQRNPHRKRERADYKRFFSISHKHLVFYSERSGFYKYYKATIEELLRRSNITIHYVTSDPKDAIFALAEQESKIKPYYIGETKLIPFMMKLDADMVVMTMTDLENFHIKRSLLRQDMEYIYMFHAPLSYIMTLNHGALDHYDTIFATGPCQVEEVRCSETVYGLPEKKIVECGYGLIDEMALEFEKIQGEQDKSGKKKLLLAPSWYEDNILDSCLDALLEDLLCEDWQLRVRPHPEYVKRYPQKMKEIQQRYRHISQEQLVFELDFSSNRSVYEADVLMTDWSLIAYEYALATLKPVFFVNTTMKVANPRWGELGIDPANVSLRDKIGIALEPSELNRSKESILRLLEQQARYKETLLSIRKEYLFHFSQGGVAGSQYILNSLLEKRKQQKEN